MREEHQVGNLGWGAAAPRSMTRTIGDPTTAEPGPHAPAFASRAQDHAQNHPQDHARPRLGAVDPT